MIVESKELQALRENRQQGQIGIALLWMPPNSSPVGIGIELSGSDWLLPAIFIRPVAERQRPTLSWQRAVHPFFFFSSFFFFFFPGLSPD